MKNALSSVDSGPLVDRLALIACAILVVVGLVWKRRIHDVGTRGLARWRLDRRRNRARRRKLKSATTGPLRPWRATAWPVWRTSTIAATTRRAPPAGAALRPAATWSSARAESRILPGSYGPWLLGGSQVDELPLVVVGPAVIDPHRRLFAFARDADNSTRGLLSGGRDKSTRIGGTCPALTSRRSGLRRRLIQELELAVGDYWVPVFPAQKMLPDQDIEIWRTGIRVLALEQADGARVLGAAENKLFLLLALRELVPGRQSDRPEDGHYAQSDQQDRHGVPVIRELRLTL